MPVNANAVVQVVRTSQGRYLAMNRNGVEVELGHAHDVFSPVELLLAALAGCAAVDVDVVTSRQAEPEVFKVGVEAENHVDGSNQLSNIQVNFSLRFPNTEEGQIATSLVERVLQLSHEKLCTVSRTLENETPVAMSVTFCRAFHETLN